MRNPGYLAMTVAMICTAPAAARTSPQVAVEQAMADSAAGWNAGDVARFMAVYSDDPLTSFLTSNGLVRGKAAMIAQYRSHYDFSDVGKRGRLTFQTLDFRLLDPKHALYIARYTLTMADGKTQSGPTSLIFRREAGQWRIIADHSG